MIISRRKMLTGAAALAAYNALPVRAADVQISQSKLTFPFGGRPRLDGSHPMSRGAMISAVELSFVGSSLVAMPVIDVITGKPATATATGNNAGIDSIIGPYANPQNVATSMVWTTSAYPQLSLGAGPNPVTWGVIFIVTSTAGATLTANGGGSTGWRIDYSTSVSLVSNGVNNTGSSFVIAANIPYFLGMSANANKVNSVLCNLATGQIFTDVKNVSGNTAGNPISTDTLVFGLGSSNSVKMSALLLANAFHGLSEMVAWAQDPWSFWYERTDDFLMAEMVGTSPAASPSRLRTLMGVGQ